MPSPDPYETLGVSPGASDAELRTAYRRLVRLHHPDHNGGSVESARRFEAVQEAYSRIRELRVKAPRSGSGQAPPPRPSSEQPPPRASVDPDVEARLANLERELREAQQARARAQRAAREAAAESEGRPSDEELGYVSTDDSFSKIFSDAVSDLSQRVSEAKGRPAGGRGGGLIDELEDLVGRFTHKQPRSRE